MLKPGDIIENYVLNVQLGRKGWYIETWRARDKHGFDVIVKLHHTTVHDDYDSQRHNLTQKIAEILPQIEHLVSLPSMPGVASWLRYHFEPDRRYLILCRRHYPDRLADRFPVNPTGARNRGPDPDFLEAFQEIAKAVDLLQENIAETIPIVPSNLLMEGSQAYLADFGLEKLHDLIEQGYAGPRMIGESSANHVHRLNEGGQFGLAAVYFYLRTGRIVFGNYVWSPTIPFFEVMVKYTQSMGEYESTGEFHLDALPDPQERRAVARALSRDPAERFPSCVQFVTSLTSGE